jgi:uncharacterized protein (TIRG00374 family)
VSRAVKLLLGIGISAVCVWYSMREVRPAEVWAALRQANYFWFVMLMLATLTGFWIRAVRWRSLLGTAKPVSYDSLYSATMIGFMANNLLPFRLGEFVRAWALARRERLSKTTVLATVVVERAVDMLTLLGIFGITLLIHPIEAGSRAGELTRAGATLLVTACAGLTVFLVVLERRPQLVKVVVNRVSAVLPERHRGRGAAAIDHFIEGLSLFRDLPRLLWVFALSFLMFGVFALGLQISMVALDIHLPWYAGLILLVITAIGIMVPAAPGYIGTMNVACVAGLALFGVSGERAVPLSWFYWVGQWVPVTVVGFFYLRREGLSLHALGEAQRGTT